MDERRVPNGEEAIDEQGRNATQRRLDDEGLERRSVDVPWQEEERMSEVIPEDEDRGGHGAMGDALEDTYGGPGASDDADDLGGLGDRPGAALEEEDEGGTGPDDGGPGSRNM